MNEGKIVLIGNETDVLHCGYSHPLSDGGKKYPSADHYAHSMILTQLGLDDAVILELLSTSSADVPAKARQLLQENMPTGHDMNSLSSYLQTSRQSYTMQGLRLRVEQDPAFERALLDTKDTLLIVCDARDSDLGIGMDEDTFIDWMAKEKIDVETLGQRLVHDRSRTPALGHNQLGYFLMWLRYEVIEKKRALLLSTQPIHVNGISVDQNGELVGITISDFVISTQGIFRPLSNYFPLPFEMKGERYRSVEHYAYQRLFEALRLSDKLIEKIRTTVNPEHVATVAKRLFKREKVDSTLLQTKMGRLDRWRQSAMKHKMIKNEGLQQLLLSTGYALIIDCSKGDKAWVSAVDEFELQHLLTKQYITSHLIVEWMAERTKPPVLLTSIKGNKTGLLLMELRSKLASSSTTQNRIPLVSNLLSAPELRLLLSSHMICFTPESVLHFFYPAEIRIGQQEVFPSPTHYIASQTVKYFNFCHEIAEWIMEPELSVECWYRLNQAIECSHAPIEKIQSWYMDERQRVIKIALMAMFEQCPPLVRCLLETGDALLVYCSRFSTLEGELSVGMRERDLRVWLSHTDIDTKQLFDAMLRPMAFRAPYLGGNRLGFILMELRREFYLRGVFFHSYPELNLTAEVVLGSDSASENYLCEYPFDILDPSNYDAIWTNPLLLLAKLKKNPDLLSLALSQKCPPKLVSVDEPKLSAIIEEIDSAVKICEEDFEYYAIEDLRSVFVRLAVRMRSRIAETDTQQNEMNSLAREITQMQNYKRSLEERKSQMDDNEEERREKAAPAVMAVNSPKSISPKRWDDRRKNRKRYSPEDKIDKQPKKRSPLNLQTMPISPPQRSSTDSPKDKERRAPVDEAELSEGEIVSD